MSALIATALIAATMAVPAESPAPVDPVCKIPTNTRTSESVEGDYRYLTIRGAIPGDAKAPKVAKSTTETINLPKNMAIAATEKTSDIVELGTSKKVGTMTTVPASHQAKVNVSAVPCTEWAIKLKGVNVVDKQDEKTSNNLPVFLTAAALSTLIFGAALFFFLTRRRKSKETENPTTNIQVENGAGGGATEAEHVVGRRR